MAVPRGAVNSSHLRSLPPAISTRVPGRFTVRACFQHEARNGGDGRQGFAAEAECGDGQKIAHVAEFAGGVAFEGEQRVVAEHAAAVVGDADKLPAARFDVDAHLCCAGVQRVLEQFLDHRSRPLYYFARRDLVCHRVRKDANPAHAFRLLDRS